MEVSLGSGVCAALCIRRTLCTHVTICTPMVIFLLFDCLLTVFDDSYTVPIVKKTLKTIGVPIVTGLQRLYQQCTNGVPIVKNSQKQSKDSQNSKNDHWCTDRYRSIKTVPTVYQQCTNRQKQLKDSQNSKNDHWCTNCHMSTKTVPTVYQQCTNRQKKSKDSQNSKNEGLRLRG